MKKRVSKRSILSHSDLGRKIVRILETFWDCRIVHILELGAQISLEPLAIFGACWHSPRLADSFPPFFWLVRQFDLPFQVRATILVK